MGVTSHIAGVTKDHAAHVPSRISHIHLGHQPHIPGTTVRIVAAVAAVTPARVTNERAAASGISWTKRANDVRLGGLGRSPVKQIGAGVRLVLLVHSSGRI